MVLHNFPDKPISADIGVRPMVRRLLTNQELEEGVDYKFEVEFIAVPKPVVQW